MVPYREQREQGHWGGGGGGRQGWKPDFSEHHFTCRFNFEAM